MAYVSSGRGREVSGLKVPPSSIGRRAAINAASKEDPKRQHSGVLQTVTSGRCSVMINGDLKWANVAPTAKAIQSGDSVTLEKRGGTWWIVAADTWHEPPTVPAPSSSTPPSADGTGSISTSMPGTSYLPYASGSTNNQLKAHADRVTDRYNELLDAVNALGLAVMNIESHHRNAINGLADSVDESVNMTSGLRSTVVGLRDGALQDRVVK